ncbi:SUI1 domain [Dillenia turbinata]|uniref:Translation machinery-associated protein 22 n=1 Tax=Dillenia turbinata TaxID=194707 RepID=A0AAN8WDY6_9MAGN
MAEKPEPVRVLYCGVCSLPAEYCEFGTDFEKCKPWLLQHASDLYPDLLKDANAKEADKLSDKLQSTGFASVSTGAGGSTDAAAPSVVLSWESLKKKKWEEMTVIGYARSRLEKIGAPSVSKEEEVKRLPGGKIKKKEKPEVIIEKVVRNRRKCITTVKGLDLFGIKLGDASKKLGKKFATGASVVKGPTEKDQIDVQGDIAYDVVEFITDSWPDVPESAIFFIEDGKKVPAA